MPWWLLARADFCALVILEGHSDPLLTGISLRDACEKVGWKTNWTPCTHSTLKQPGLESLTSPAGWCFLFLRWLWRKWKTSDHWICLEVKHGTSVSFMMRWKVVLFHMFPPWYIEVPLVQSKGIDLWWMEPQKWQTKVNPFFKMWGILDMCYNHGNQVNTPFHRRVSLSGAGIHCRKDRGKIWDSNLDFCLG